MIKNCKNESSNETTKLYKSNFNRIIYRKKEIDIDIYLIKNTLKK